MEYIIIIDLKQELLKKLEPKKKKLSWNLANFTLVANVTPFDGIKLPSYMYS